MSDGLQERADKGSDEFVAGWKAGRAAVLDALDKAIESADIRWDGATTDDTDTFHALIQAQRDALGEALR